MIKQVLIIAIATASLLIAACSGSPIEYGAIQGKVTIGPLMPVVQPGVVYEIPCEVYEARKILIYKENGRDLIEEVSIDCDGNYQVKLPSGSYVIDINRIGVDHSSEVPAEIEVRPFKTIHLDIDIDTGIR